MTDADCELEPPLGKGKGYFCALQPCCTNVAPVLNALPQAMLGNVSINAGTANQPRRICRRMLRAVHPSVCTSQQANLSLESPVGLTFGMTSPSLLATAVNQSAVAGQVQSLQKSYSELLEAAVNFTRTVSPEALGDIQQQLAEQALQAFPASAGVPSMDNLQRQLNAAVLNFTFANAAFSATMPSGIYPGQKTLTTGSLRVG
eukprot:jgi/Botrbrau1/12588/Bobra.0169s0117.1